MREIKIACVTSEIVERKMDTEQDRTLPIANVGRIMKQILPPSAKISKEGKQLMQECVTEFISFVTGEASDKCHKENRKTVNGDDICWALSSLGFDNYAEAIARYLHKYRQAEREKVNHTHNNNKFDSANKERYEDGSSAATGAARIQQQHEKQAEILAPLECRVTENPPAN